MRLSPVPAACLLLVVLLAAPGLGLNQGNGFRWFWRGSSGGSATHKFSVSNRGGSTTGSHSMVVVRVKDSNGRTVLLDPANPQTTRRVVHGFSGKGANKATFTLTKTLGGISSGGDPVLIKPSKHMLPPPPTKEATPAPPAASVAKVIPANWFRPPAVDATPAPVHFLQPTSTTDKPAFQPQFSSKLILARPTSKPSGAYLPPVPTTSRPVVTNFRLTAPAATVAAPTPTPASHVGKDIRRNLNSRVDGSVFFGILPVVNDLQRTPQAKTEPPPKVIISRRPGKCPFINMTRCPPPTPIQHGRCSNDNQCPTEQRCCYNPCKASSQCMTAIL